VVFRAGLPHAATGKLLREEIVREVRDICAKRRTT